MLHHAFSWLREKSSGAFLGLEDTVTGVNDGVDRTIDNVIRRAAKRPPYYQEFRDVERRLKARQDSVQSQLDFLPLGSKDSTLRLELSRIATALSRLANEWTHHVSEGGPDDIFLAYLNEVASGEIPKSQPARGRVVRPDLRSTVGRRMQCEFRSMSSPESSRHLLEFNWTAAGPRLESLKADLMASPKFESMIPSDCEVYIYRKDSVPRKDFEPGSTRWQYLDHDAALHKALVDGTSKLYIVARQKGSKFWLVVIGCSARNQDLTKIHEPESLNVTLALQQHGADQCQRFNPNVSDASRQGERIPMEDWSQACSTPYHCHVCFTETDRGRCRFALELTAIT